MGPFWTTSGTSWDQDRSQDQLLFDRSNRLANSAAGAVEGSSSGRFSDAAGDLHERADTAAMMPLAARCPAARPRAGCGRSGSRPTTTAVRLRVRHASRDEGHHGRGGPAVQAQEACPYCRSASAAGGSAGSAGEAAVGVGHPQSAVRRGDAEGQRRAGQLTVFVGGVRGDRRPGQAAVCGAGRRDRGPRRRLPSSAGCRRRRWC